MQQNGYHGKDHEFVVLTRMIVNEPQLVANKK